MSAMTSAIALQIPGRLKRPPRFSDGRVLSAMTDGLLDALLLEGLTAPMRPTSLDLPRYCDLVEQAAEQTGNDAFGLERGRDSMHERLGLVADIVLASPTIGVALDNLVRCFLFHQQNTAIAFRRDAGHCRLEYRILDGRILQRRQDAELTISSLLCLLRQCLGRGWVPDEVHFEHPRPEHIQPHRQILAAPVYFSMTTNALLFREPDLSRSLPGRDTDRVEALCRNLVQLAGTTETLSLTDQVAGEIRSRLPAGHPHVEDVAEALRMTRWTLQRRLAEHGVVFSDLVERVRRGLAELHLGAAHMPIREIADVLGYSELSAFTRACVRWFGVPPSKIRERILAAPANVARCQPRGRASP